MSTLRAFAASIFRSGEAAGFDNGVTFQREKSRATLIAYSLYLLFLGMVAGGMLIWNIIRVPA